MSFRSGMIANTFLWPLASQMDSRRKDLVEVTDDVDMKVYKYVVRQRSTMDG